MSGDGIEPDRTDAPELTERQLAALDVLAGGGTWDAAMAAAGVRSRSTLAGWVRSEAWQAELRRRRELLAARSVHQALVVFERCWEVITRALDTDPDPRFALEVLARLMGTPGRGWLATLERAGQPTGPDPEAPALRLMRHPGAA